MKRILFPILFFAGIAVGIAQTDKEGNRQEADLDRLQQEPQRPTQVEQERAARIEAQRAYNEKVEKKRAKKIARIEERERAKEMQ